MAEFTEDQANAFEIPMDQSQMTPAPIVPQDDPVKKAAAAPKKELSYEEATRRISTASKAELPFYDTGYLDQKTANYKESKPFLDQEYGYMAGQDNADIYAKQQSWYTELPKAIAKFPLITLAKVGQQVGFTLGLINPVNWLSEDGLISAASDNGIAKAFEGMEDAVKHDFLPTFQEAADRNKGFFSRAFTDLNFWTEDVMDGAAFMASAFIPGMALAKMGSGMKFAQMLSRTRAGAAAADAVVDGAGLTQRYLANAQRVANTFDTVTTWATATAGEAMFEAKDVRDNVLNSLDGKLNPETGHVYTEAEKRSIAGGAAKNTFLMNTALLSFTNAIQMSYLFKALGVGEASVGKISQRALGETFERTAATTKLGQFLDTKWGAAAKGVVGGTISEGFVEENTQLAIQRMNQQYGALGKIVGFDEYSKLGGRLADQTVDALKGDDTEVSTSIGLGAILGGGMGSVGDIREHGREKLTTQLAIAKLNAAQDNFLKFGDIYEKEEITTNNEQGEEVVTKKTKLDENNQPIIDQAKMAQAISGLQNNVAMTGEAESLKDKNQASFLKDLAFRDFVQAHIEADIENGLLQKLDGVAKAKPEDLARMGFDPDSSEENTAAQVAEYKALAKEFIAQNKLIKNSMLVQADPATEQARKNKLVELATEQTIMRRVAKKVNNQSAQIKTSLLSFDDASTTDEAVDKLNSLQYRIGSQMKTLDVLRSGGIKSNFEIRAAESLLQELVKEKKKLLTDHKDALEGLQANEETGVYKYEDPARNDNPLNKAYQEKLMERGAYENAARHKGLQFARLIDTKNGVKNFNEYVEDDVVAPLNDIQEQENKEEEAAALAAVTIPAPVASDPADPADPAVPGAPPIIAPTVTAPVVPFTSGADIIDVGPAEARDEHEPKLYAGETLVSGKKGWFIVKALDTYLLMDSLRRSTEGVFENPGYYALSSAETARDKAIAQDELKNIERHAPFQFDGQTMQIGQVLVDKLDGSEWMVNASKPKMVRGKAKLDIAMLNPDRSLNGRISEIGSLKGFTVKQKEKVEELVNGKPRFKLFRENELNRIYPIDHNQAALDNLLINTPLNDLLNNITISVNKGIKSRVAKQVIGDPTKQAPSEHLFQVPEGLKVEIKYKGRTIGFLSNFDQYHILDDDGHPMSIESLSLNNFKKIFDTTGKDPQQAMQNFKENYRKSKKIFSVLYSKIGDQDGMELDNTEVNELLSLGVGNGQFNYSEDENNGVALDDLQHKTINGQIYVINTARRYGKGYEYTETPIAVTLATSKERAQIEKEIADDKLAMGKDNAAKLGRYVAVVKLPNGTIRYVELKTAKWTEEDLEKLVNDINERSAITKKENLVEKEDGNRIHGKNGWEVGKYIGGKDPKFNDKLNKELAEKLFISVPLAAKGTYIDFYVNATGNLQIKFNKKVGNKDIKAIIAVTGGKNEHTPIDFKNVDDMIDRINKAIESHNKKARSNDTRILFTLTRDNFKNAIPDDAGVTEMKGMKTNLEPSVVTDLSLSVNPKPGIESQIKVPVTKLPAVVAPPVVSTTTPKAPVPSPRMGGQTVEVDEKTRLMNELMSLAQPMSSVPPVKTTTEVTLPPLGDRGLNPNNTPTVPVIQPTITPDPATVDQTKPAPSVKQPRAKTEFEILTADRQNYAMQRAKALEPEMGRGKAMIQARKEAGILYDKRLEALKQNIKGAALKVTDRDNFTEGEVENIDRFKSWVKKNLPDFIDVEETEQFSQNMKKEGATVGMFLAYMQRLQKGNFAVKGKIRVGKETAFKYHEAFHGVFRLLLSDKKAKQLLDIARREVKEKYNKQELTSELQRFRESHPIYKVMTPEELSERFHEEYLADKFDAWMMNKGVKTSHVNKSFFAKIADWFTNLFKRMTMSELEGLFTDINNGKYRHSKFADNEFTKPTALSITNPVMKAIKVDDIPVTDENGNEVMIEKFLSQEEGDQIASTIASLFHVQALSSEKGYNKKELLNDILNDYANLYNPENDNYSNAMDNMDMEDAELYMDKLMQKHKIFSDPENRQSIIDAVDVQLRVMGFKQDLETDEYLETEDEFGSRVTVDNWKETHSIGGFGSLSQFLRQYIAATHYEFTDEFGNSMLKEGVPLIQAVNANLVYNGILNTVANISDANKVMARMKLLKDNGTETGRFISKFFMDAGIEFHPDGSFYVTNTKQVQLVTQVIKGFNQFSVDYIFINKDISSKKKVAHLMLANRRDAAKTQFSIWQNAYIHVFEDQVLRLKENDDKKAFYKKRTEALQDLYSLMDPAAELDNEKWDTEATNISNQIKLDLGISLAPLLIKHALVANKSEELLTPEQKFLLQAYDNIESITRDDVNQIMKSVMAGENPFAKNLENPDLENDETDEDEKVDKSREMGTGGVITRLNKIAKNNANFDETVYSTSFKNADGELVYGHQLPTYHLVRILELNEQQEIDKMKQDAYLSNNMLLNSPEYQALQGLMKVSRIDGLKSSFLNKTDEGWAEDKSMTINQNKGITYGSFSDREMLVTLFDLYGYNKEHQTENGSFLTSQHLIRVLESSNTADTVNLPVIRAVQLNRAGEIELTDQALEILYNEVQTETDRIQRVREEISSGNYIDGEIAGYHYGENKATGNKRDTTKGRGLQFYKMKLMLGEELGGKILQAMQNPDFNLASFKEQIRDQVEKYWLNEFKDTTQLLLKQGVIGAPQKTKDNGLKFADQDESIDTYENLLMGDFMSKGFTRDEEGKTEPVEDERKNSHMNLIPHKIEHNIAQVVMNDFLNTLSLNQLLLGDQSRSLKDAIDEVKRAKGANGSGPSLESFLIAPSLGINHAFINSHVGIFEDPMYTAKFAGGMAQKADGQTWFTPKGMRYTLHGLGKLSPNIARILDKIERGKKLTEEEVFDQLKAQDVMFNSLKLVYYDGPQYIKTSVVMLTKEFTSYKDENGVWQAQLGREELHTLREKMEDFEKRQQTVTFSIPASAAKGLKRNVAQDVGSLEDKSWNLQQTKYWRLQLENPSNKIEITDPTQAKQIILSEQNNNLQVSFMGVNTTIGDLKKIYMKDVSQRVKNNFRMARNQIFDIDGAFEELSNSIKLGQITPNLKKFQKRAVENLMATGADSQIIDFFSLDRDGEPKYNLNNPITLDKYTQLFLAYFSKGVMSEKIPGHSVALMSNYGVKVLKRFTGKYMEDGAPIGEVIRNDVYKQDPEAYKDAKRWNNDLERTFDGLQEGDFYVDDLRHNIPEYDKNGKIIGRYTEFMMPAHFRELLKMLPEDKMNELISKMFGTRIPSQDKHSLVSLRHVDFMPAYYGSTAIFPHELVEISGADFDIDKLYMHIVDTYSRDGKLHAFGTQTTPEGRYDEYIESLWKYNKDFKGRVKELKKEAGLPVTEDDERYGEEEALYPDNGEQMVADLIFSSLDKESNKLFIQVALQELGLPLNVKQFQDATAQYGELNNGVLNNKILDAKIRLLDNEHITNAENGVPIAYEVASVDPLKTVVDELIEEFGDVAPLMDIVQEGGTDGDSIRGKFKAYKNNKEGSRNIAPAVNALLAYSTLSSFKVKFRAYSSRFYTDEVSKQVQEIRDEIPRLKYEGKILDTYAPTHEGKESLRAYDKATKTFTGARIFGTISTLASAMMDNAKERLAARLGLNMDAVGHVSNMVAQGMPLKTAVRFMLQPAVREYFDLIKVVSNKLKTGSEGNIKKGDVLGDLIQKYMPDPDFLKENDLDLDITDEMLNQGLKTNGASTIDQYIVLRNLETILHQSRSYGKVAQVLKLTKGLGTSWESLEKVQKNITDLGLRMSEKDFLASDLPIDMRQIFMARDKAKPYHVFANNYIRITDQIEHLSKTLFLEKTDVFKRIESIVLDNLEVRNATKKTFLPALKRDLISYLSIKAYMKTLKDNNMMGTLKTMNQAIIYDEAAKNDDTFKDIIDIIKDIRVTMPRNYIANNFLNAISTQVRNNEGEYGMNELNRDGINKLEANTWAKLSEYQTEKLRDSFIEIYQHSDEMREHAVALFNYLLVKDGGQFKSNSFIRFVPNFMFDGLLKATGKANEVLALEEEYKTKEEKQRRYEEVFGVGHEDLFNEFMVSYTTHIVNAYQTFTVKSMSPKYQAKDMVEEQAKKYNPAEHDVFKVDKGVVKINLFGGIRPGNIPYDTGTTDGIIYVDHPNKGKKYNPAESQMLGKNKSYLMSKGLIQVIEGNKSTFEFPYVIRFSDMGGNTSWYVLKSVGKQKAEKGKNSIIPSRVINDGENVARGIQAVYVKLEMKGSKRQWAAAAVFGEIPALPKAPRNRRELMSDGRYSGGYASNRTEEEVMKTMDLGPEDLVQKTNKTTAPVESKVGVTLEPVQLLRKHFDIKVSLSSAGITFTGELWDMIPKTDQDKLKTPRQVLDYFNYGYDEVQDRTDPFEFTKEELTEDYSQITGEPLGQSNDMPESAPMDSFSSNDAPLETDMNASMEAALRRQQGESKPVDLDLFKRMSDAFKNGHNPLKDDCA